MNKGNLQGNEQRKPHKLYLHPHQYTNQHNTKHTHRHTHTCIICHLPGGSLLAPKPRPEVYIVYPIEKKLLQLEFESQ